jgi:thioesterase domain-containing protein
MSLRNVRELRVVIDELANAIQGAVGLAALVRRQAQTTADDAIKLEGVIARAASTLKRAQPSGPGRGGR